MSGEHKKSDLLCICRQELLLTSALEENAASHARAYLDSPRKLLKDTLEENVACDLTQRAEADMFHQIISLDQSYASKSRLSSTVDLVQWTGASIDASYQIIPKIMDHQAHQMMV